MEFLGNGLWIFGSVVLGLWLADFATGCFHWLVDNYCDPAWPIIGPHYILPSHLHHDEEMFEFELSSVGANLHIWTSVVIVGLTFWFLGLMNLTIMAACIFGFLTNVIHRWSHTRAKDNTAIVKLLQRWGFFQSTEHHTIHHSGESNTHYCLLTNHLNPLVEWSGLWRHLDKGLASIGIRKLWWEEAMEPS